MSQMQYASRIQPGSPYLRCHLTASVKLLYRYWSESFHAPRRSLVCIKYATSLAAQGAGTPGARVEAHLRACQPLSRGNLETMHRYQ